MKKIIFSCLLFLGIGTSVFAYSDVSESHKFFDSIARVTELNIFSGNPDGTFKPEKTINRAELVKVLVEREYFGHDKEYFADKECFSDVVPNEWYTKYVCFAKDKGHIDGYPDGTFKPEQEVNLVEALKMFIEIRIYGYGDLKSDPWYKVYVEKAGSSIPLDFTAFDQKVTRAQVANLLDRAMTDFGFMQIGKHFLWEYPVTNESLTNHTNMEEIAYSVNSIEDSPISQVEDYENDLGYKVIFYSEDAVVNENGYYEGNFSISMASANGKKLDKMVSKTDVGEMVVEEGAMKVFEPDSSFVVVQEFGSEGYNYYSIYELLNERSGYVSSDYADLMPISDVENNYIIASSFDDFVFDGDQLVIAAYDVKTGDKVTKRYALDKSYGGEFVLQQ